MEPHGTLFGLNNRKENKAMRGMTNADEKILEAKMGG